MVDGLIYTFVYASMMWSGLSMNGVRLHSHEPTQTSIYLCVPLSHLQSFLWQVNSTPTLQQVCLVILLKIIHLQLLIKLSFQS